MKPDNVFTVAQLNREAKRLLESSLGTVWITGELSNLARPSSGHFYFTLKDPNAQVRCALFRMNRRRVDFPPENGQQVLVQAQVSLYEGRGDYQLIVTQMQLAGSGALQIAFDKLKAKLQAEGLFDESRKQTLPTFPRCIGVVTSNSGAAIRDILKVLKRRNPSIPVIIYPSLVQGNEAAPQIAKAIETASRRQECDLLIVARGGGSLEDLWPFNEEIVARAIAASKLPIVSGVGHEVDFTIADFVADLRAATPSAAAEAVTLDQSTLLKTLSHLEQRLTKHITHTLNQAQQQLTHLTKRLRHPRERLQEQAQKLDQLEQALLRNMQQSLNKNQETINIFKKDIESHMNNALRLAKQQLIYIKKRLRDPKSYLQEHSQNLKQLEKLLKLHTDKNLTSYKSNMQMLQHRLDALNPFATLKRGYAILTDQDGKVIDSINKISPGKQISAQVTDGIIQAETT